MRGLLPWPDFLNCISIYNDEDFKAYFAAMLRMRFNMFGMHVYTENEPGPLAESYLSYEFAGSGHRAALEDTTMTAWGYLPQRTSTFKMGAAQFFDSETFGAEATRSGADNWDIAARTTAMMRCRVRVCRGAGDSHRHRLRAVSESCGDRSRVASGSAHTSRRVHRIEHCTRSARTAPGRSAGPLSHGRLCLAVGG